jgi:DNA-binding transcriptional ArsR family regulator
MFGCLAETAGMFASPSRIELLDLLAQGERSVEELSEASRLSIANASQHLQQLRRAGVVSRRRRGRQILYDLADEQVLDLMAILRGMAEANHAVAQRTVDHWYHARDPLAPVTSDELTERLKCRSVPLIDVRPKSSIRFRPVLASNRRRSCGNRPEEAERTPMRRALWSPGRRRNAHQRHNRSWQRR